MSRACSLHAEILAPQLNATKINFCNYMTIKPTRLVGIPVLWCQDPSRKFPSNPACWAARRMNQPKTRTAGNTFLMHIASNLYIKVATTGWPLSCNTRIKVTSAVLTCPTNRVGPAHVTRTLLSVVLSSILHEKALEFAVFEREYD